VLRLLTPLGVDRKNAIERVLNRNKGGSVATINPLGR